MTTTGKNEDKVKVHYTGRFEDGLVGMQEEEYSLPMSLHHYVT